MMGLGMMIGAGVFIGIGISIRVAGPGGVILTFALNGLIAIFTAMSFAELSSAIPKAGGTYNFARIAFGRGPSFMAGWMEWFASCVAGSLYSVVFAMYTLDFFFQLGLLNWLTIDIEIARKVVAFLVAGFFIYINYRGASETGKIGALFTVAQMLFMFGIAVTGLIIAFVDPSRLENFKPFMPEGWSALLITMGFVYVAFEGFEVIAQAGDEAIDPRRNIPKAMLYSVFFAALTYILVSFATIVSVKAGSDGVGAQPWKWIGGFGETGFGQAIQKLIPMGIGGILVTLAVIFSSTSALNATIYSATRASYALGRDRMLPAAFSKISLKRKTPYIALFFTAIIVLSVVLPRRTEDIASSASIMFLFLFFVANICVIRIRLNMGDELSYGFLMPLFPLFPVLAIIAQIVLAVWLGHMSVFAWKVSIAWIISGIAIYLFYSKSRAISTEDEILVFEEKKAPAAETPVRPLPEGEYRVMVAVANPNNALELVSNTYKICGAKQASVELLHMVPVPDQVPLTDAPKYMLEGKEGILEAMLTLGLQFPISTTIRYCRNIARGIISAVRQKKINTLIMGWHGRAKSHLFDIGSTVDPIIERSPCNVVILKDCGGVRQFKRILVPVAGGPNGAFALEVASILADKEEGEIVAFTIDGTREFDLAAFLAENQPRLHLPADRIQPKTVRRKKIARAILREIDQDGYDLVVLGCTDKPIVYQMTHETIPETVARQCNRPLVMVKSSVGIRSWLKRWI